MRRSRYRLWRWDKWGDRPPRGDHHRASNRITRRPRAGRPGRCRHRAAGPVVPALGRRRLPGHGGAGRRRHPVVARGDLRLRPGRSGHPPERRRAPRPPRHLGRRPRALRVGLVVAAVDGARQRGCAGGGAVRAVGPAGAQPRRGGGRRGRPRRGPVGRGARASPAGRRRDDGRADRRGALPARPGGGGHGAHPAGRPRAGRGPGRPPLGAGAPRAGPGRDLRRADRGRAGPLRDGLRRRRPGARPGAGRSARPLAPGPRRAGGRRRAHRRLRPGEPGARWGLATELDPGQGPGHRPGPAGRPRADRHRRSPDA